MRQQSNGLNCLAKTHLISQYAVDSLLIKVVQPLQAFKLVALEITFEPQRLRYCQGQLFLVIDTATSGFLLDRVLTTLIVDDLEILLTDLILVIIIIKVSQPLTVLIDYTSDVFASGSPLIVTKIKL